MTRNRVLALIALLILTIAGTACGDDDGVETDGGSPDDVLIAVKIGGGFVRQGTDFASVPTLVLRDGTVITAGPSTAIYPGPAVAPVVTGHLTDDEVADLLAAAADAGLDAEPVDAGQPGITDLPTTTVRIAFGDRIRTHEVYGLGTGDDSADLTDDQRRAREAVGDLVGEITNVAGTAADEPHEPVGYQVMAFPVSAEDLEGAEVAPNELAWPFVDIPLVAEGCLDIEDDRTAVLTEALAGATEITVWTGSDGGRWQLAIRQSLPGDTRCTP